ncbi:MAG: hypothetical protein QHJ34_15230 [bacterium]|jgi:hypothetical protein|nr:hypothetical protein [candidate division KSB1 bacterium]MDH7561555.1 hypothetical protein [bacterium]
MMLSCGPVDVAPGDSATVVLAIIAVKDTAELQAVATLRQEAEALQWAFRHGAGLFCGTPATAPGADSLAMPVHLLSFAQVERLRFTLSFEPRLLRFAGVVPSENDLPLHVVTHPVDEGTVAVEVSFSPGALSPAGNHALLNALFQVANEALPAWIPVRLLEGEYWTVLAGGWPATPQAGLSA